MQFNKFGRTFQAYVQADSKFRLRPEEIANLTATSRQTVTTTLNDLRYKKLLTFNRSRLLVRDLEKLEMEFKNG